ncbi:MAG: uroporphyrinogen-III C-methyltransferase [Microthrixaceae bacterium]
MTVYLVGAGPGDPGLVTVRGAELLARADVVVYDRLTASELLDLTPAGCALTHVGKRPGAASIDQAEINEILVDLGRAHDCVVRLKGGDPYVFARGAEEAAALAEAGVAYEVVPGITSAFAAPAAAGIPVTMRYSSTHVTVVTGHEDPTKGRTEVNWEAIAAAGGTIVILMGVSRWGAISERLLAGGLAPDTPAAAVHWGTTVDQVTVRATLATLGQEDLRAPSVIVVGAVAAQQLDWLGAKPLFGRRVVVTRAREQASYLAERLGDLGAEVVLAPTIAIEDPSDGGEALGACVERLAVARPEWVVFSSANAVDRFVGALHDVRDLAGIEVAAIGPGTTGALARHGLRTDIVPDRYVAEALLEIFPAPSPGSGTVLIPRAEVARDVLVDGLGARGWSVEVVPAYRTVPVPPDPSMESAVRSADAICFASSSSVSNFVAAYGDSVPPVVAAIGPITAARAEEEGLDVAVIPGSATIIAMADALADHFARLG